MKKKRLTEVRTYTSKTSLIEVRNRDEAFGLVEGQDETTEEFQETK